VSFATPQPEDDGVISQQKELGEANSSARRILAKVTPAWRVEGEEGVKRLTPSSRRAKCGPHYYVRPPRQPMVHESALTGFHGYYCAMSGDVVPMMSYRRGVEAIDWLVAAFGFSERVRMVSDEGRLEHAELGAGSGTIMLATPSLNYEGPALHRSHCESSARWQEVPYLVDGVLVLVDDVDAHCKIARDHGATILTEVESTEHGKRYRAEDLEGHRWMFVERGSFS
jgi:uncharacterized glyoxalase superfamily protein PhnB